MSQVEAKIAVACAINHIQRGRFAEVFRSRGVRDVGIVEQSHFCHRQWRDGQNTQRTG